MSDLLGIKISELPEITDLNGTHTIGIDKNTKSGKVSLDFIKQAADYANAQGDYAKEAGDTVNGNAGVNDYPAFSASATYSAGDVVRYNGVLYEFNGYHNGPWSGTDVKRTSINTQLHNDFNTLEAETSAGVREATSKVDAIESSVNTFKQEVSTEIDAFKEAVTDQVNNYAPIIINGDVTNAPDEEDLTSENGLLKFKNRSALSGMGYVVLRMDDNVDNAFRNQVKLPNTIYEIRYNFDLNEEEVLLPSNVILYFNGGSISNGILMGDSTKIAASLARIFSNIIIDGSWILSDIYSEWFDFKEGKIDNIQNFRNLMNLANSSNLSHIYIQDGEWYTSTFSTDKNGVYLNNQGIIVPSNVYIHNSATIKQLPTEHEKTAMFHITSNNVTIDGGKLVGDVREHLGTTGEFNFGIYPVGASNVVIKNIEICEFWGDGIDIQSPYMDYENQTPFNHCRNIVIENVKCLNNRRQGLSVEAVDGLIVKDSEFRGTGSISYTGPGAGIDIEPWHDYQIIKNIVIENCQITNNATYLLIHLRKSFSQENNNIHILNCYSDKGIFAKNVKGLYVDNFKSVGQSTYLSLWENGENIQISSSSFQNELYIKGNFKDVLINRCDFDMLTDAWSGFGITFEQNEGETFENIKITHCNIKTNNKARTIYCNALNTDIHFEYNKFFSTRNAAMHSLGCGNFIGNEFISVGGRFFLKNTTGKEVNIVDNIFHISSYVDTLMSFSSSVTLVEGCDFVFLNNHIYTPNGYWTLFGGETDSVICRFEDNIFTKEISQFLPTHWTLVSSLQHAGDNYKSMSILPRQNILVSQCQKITVPLIRGQVKISSMRYYVGSVHMITADTIFEINESTREVYHYTTLSKTTDISSYGNALPVFATEVDGDFVHIYIQEGGVQTFRNTIMVDYFAQSAIKNSDLKYAVVSRPSLTFGINIQTKCIVSSLSLPSFIQKYNGFEVYYKGKTISYYNGAWVDASGVEVI